MGIAASARGKINVPDRRNPRVQFRTLGFFLLSAPGMGAV
jgi:hypothetical protein